MKKILSFQNIYLTRIYLKCKKNNKELHNHYYRVVTFSNLTCNFHGTSFQPFPPLSLSHTPNIYIHTHHHIYIHTQITHSLSSSFRSVSRSVSHHSISYLGFTISPFQTTMKVHPAPHKRNITVRYDFAAQSTAAGSICRQKKLRRLPHIFGKVLELPFYSDADVTVQETSDSFRFVVDTEDDIGTDIAAHTIEICPGVTKVVVRTTRGGGDGAGACYGGV
uniref:Uncharacterized protein n=1 Tax=Helianthus annuus TaxID=4232 RepID=A0A251SCS3_HELAN